jgi:hypothetical protein
VVDQGFGRINAAWRLSNTRRVRCVGNYAGIISNGGSAD